MADRLVFAIFQGVSIDRLHYPTTPVTTVGRSEQSLIRLDSPFVSRNHAQIDHTAATSTWIIRDVGSRNGTFVNNVRMRESNLRAGDFIKIGPYQINVWLPGM